MCRDQRIPDVLDAVTGDDADQASAAVLTLHSGCGIELGDAQQLFLEMFVQNYIRNAALLCLTQLTEKADQSDNDGRDADRDVDYGCSRVRTAGRNETPTPRKSWQSSFRRFQKPAPLRRYLVIATL